MVWFACDREVWGADRGVKGESAKAIVDRDRGEDCFFWPVQAGMSFDAAKILQQRAAADRASNSGYRHAQWDRWIATIGVAVRVAYQVVRDLYGEGPEFPVAGRAVGAAE